ncbi:hypothetical protein R1flu_015803 [Riccia fluitans]|uniref:Uncharacterized protein n=1 Tax=Riccia fluitans TaxID=41844 RepID=A0ABD1YNW7_9MARC
MMTREGEEDDSSADEGEIQGRLAFMGEKITDPKNRTGVFEATEEMASEERLVLESRDEDEEEEERRWEEEQLRKGYGKRVEEAPPRSTPAAPAGPSQAQVPAYITAVQPVVPSGGVRGFGRPLEGLSIAQQAEAAMRSLKRVFRDYGKLIRGPRMICTGARESGINSPECYLF